MNTPNTDEFETSREKGGGLGQEGELTYRAC